MIFIPSESDSYSCLLRSLFPANCSPSALPLRRSPARRIPIGGMGVGEEFARSVEDGLKLAKRIYTGKAAAAAAPRPADGMERHAEERLLPAAPMMYAVIDDPGIVDNPDVPSYQPHVYGRCDPPALIPLQMKEIALEAEIALDTAFVTVRGRWWVHCVTRNRSCDARLALPMGDEGSILGVEINVGRRSHTTQVIESEDPIMEKVAKTDGGGYIKPQLFLLTIPQVGGGSDIFVTIKWSQKISYEDGRFTIDLPFRFPPYVNLSSKIFVKTEKILLTVNSGTGKEVILQSASHALKEKNRQGGKLTFLYESAVDNWSNKNFHFTYNVYSGDLFGGILVKSPSTQEYDQRDMFCLFLFPGSTQNRKVFKKKVVYVVDTSESMEGKPLEDVKSTLSAALLELSHGDYFNIIAFNDELLSFSSCLEPATEEIIGKANQWMLTNFVAKGGTDIMHPLNEAIALLSNSGDYLPHIFLITDGAVEDERNICSTMRNHITNRGSSFPRISTFGIGSFFNHYFLRMLASIGRGHYDAAFDSDSIRSRMQRWLRRVSGAIVTNITVDAFNCLDEFEVYQDHVLDISMGHPLFLSGRYHGRFPDSLKAKGSLADMSEIVIDLRVQHAQDIPLEKIFAKQHIELLTAQAWFSESNQLEKKVTKLSVLSGIPSEYTNMVLLTNSGKMDQAKQVKSRRLGKPVGPEEPSPTLVRSLTVGFGNIAATKENLPGFAELKQPDTFHVINKAMGCCSRLGDCCCCACFINACSKLNDQCFIVLTQLCAALSCLGCMECCSEVCCRGSDS